MNTPNPAVIRFVGAFRTFSESTDPRAPEWLRALTARVGESLLSATDYDFATATYAAWERVHSFEGEETRTAAQRRMDAHENNRAGQSAVNIAARAVPNYCGKIDLSEDPWTL